MNFTLPETLLNVTHALAKKGGRVILIGGATRDYWRNQLFEAHSASEYAPKDYDIEIYGLSADILVEVLKQFGRVLSVGKQFQVFKLLIVENSSTDTEKSHQEYDFSLPRREQKIGLGHKGFHVTGDPYMSFEEATSRRDFTVNGIGYDLLKQEWLDPFDGIEDIRKKTLRHISAAFSEDPLRVFRAMQFSARFEFQIAPQTVVLCREQDCSELPKERIFTEWSKLLLKAKRPSLGLKAAQAMGVLEYFPELLSLIHVPQDPEWHPEGDVWTHTLMVLDEAAKLRQSGDSHTEKSNLILMLSALCHDLGKPLTTEFRMGRWRSHEHDFRGIAPTESFLRRMTEEKHLIEQVKILVKEHLIPSQLYRVRDRLSKGAIRRLSLRVDIPELVRLAQADHLGRGTAEACAKNFPAGTWLLEEADKLNVKEEPPQPLLMGRHLMQLGVSPGPDMGKLLKQAFALQLDGELNNLQEATAWASKILIKA